MRSLTVGSGSGADAVDLAVCVHEPREIPTVGRPAGADVPTVLLVHGYPDTQTVWDPVVERLVPRHRVVTYDVRGAGRSTAPRRTAGYRVARLVDDLVAVLDAVDPAAGVHLVGHDWGSTALWDAVCLERDDPRLHGRLASFCSISGPGLDHLAEFARTARRDGRAGLLRAQRRRSWYAAAFHLPVLPELAWTLLARPIRTRLAAAERLSDGGHWADTFGRDARRGLALYRANLRPRLRTPAGDGSTRLPVTLVVPRHDAFVTPALAGAAAAANPHLERVDVPAGHWVLRTHPDQVAAIVADTVRRARGAGALE